MYRNVLLFMAALYSLCAHGQTKPLSLKQAIGIGLRQHPEILAAQANRDAARGRYWRGISLPSPEVSVANEYIPKGTGLQGFSERSIGLSQSFEFPTNYFLKGSIANSEEAINSRLMDHATRRVVTHIKKTYYNAMADRIRLQYASDNLVVSEAIAAKVEIRSKVGEATPLERLTANVQRSEARNAVRTAHNQLAASYSDLNQAMGFSAIMYDTSVVLSDSLTSELRPLSFDSLSTELESKNALVNATRAKVDQADVSNSLAWSSLLPNFTIAYYGQSRDGSNNYYGASLGISIPLWFMFEHKGKIQESQANVLLAQAELSSIRNTVNADLRNAVTTALNNENSVRLYLRDLLPQSEEIHRTAQRSYNAGEISYLEYLQAKLILNSTRNSYVTALVDYWQSIALIDELTGVDPAKDEMEK